MIDDQPPKRQRDLFADYGQHARATRRESVKAHRRPMLADIIEHLRSCGTAGATRYEIADAIDRPIQSVCRPCLAILNDQSAVETGERRKTRWGRWAAVMVAREYLRDGVTS